MNWFEIQIKTTDEAQDAISEMLTSIGAGGVAIEDPNDIRREIEKSTSLDYADDKFMSSLGEDVTIKAYFQGDQSIIQLSELIKEKIKFVSNFLDVGKGYTGYKEIDEEDWATAWKKYYKPVRISDRVVIKPSWEAYEQQPGEVVIELDPGMAFGTGTHETTRMCTYLLDKYIKQGDRVVDLGCGTGILAIAAVMLGAGRVTAVDIDEVAVRVTRENCRINHVEDRIDAFRGVLKDIPAEKSDIFVANIIANVIIDIAPDIPYYLKDGGVYITSGIIKERKQGVLDAYSKRGFVPEEMEEIGEWVAIVFRYRGSL